MIEKPERLAYTLGYELSFLETIIDSIDKYYYKFVRIKKNGESRNIYPSTNPLKQIQSRIKSRILEKIHYPEYLLGGLKGKNNIKNANFHLGKKYKFCTDIKNFFPSVSSSQVYKMFLKNGFSPDVSRLLTRLTTYKFQLPQGTPTSSHIANLVFMDVDKIIVKICNENGITYSRYIDDITLSSSNDFKKNIPSTVDNINKNGYRINHRKTFYKKGPAEITGIITGNNTLKPNDSIVQKMKDPDIKDSTKNSLIAYDKRVRNRGKNSPKNKVS